jgi:hypothetical protein
VRSTDHGTTEKEKKKYMQHSGAQGPLLDRRIPVIRTGLPYPFLSALHTLSHIEFEVYFYRFSDAHFPNIFQSTLLQHGNKS